MITIGPVIGLTTPNSTRVLFETTENFSDFKVSLRPLTDDELEIGTTKTLSQKVDEHQKLQSTQPQPLKNILINHCSRIFSSVFSVCGSHQPEVDTDDYDSFNSEQHVSQDHTSHEHANTNSLDNRVVKVIDHVEANRAQVVQFDGLTANTKYVFEFVDQRINKTGVPRSIIHTQNPTSTLFNIACVSCNLPSRSGSKNMWKDLSKRVTKPNCEGERIHAIVHMGDQIYSDMDTDCYDKCIRLVNEKGRHNIENEDFEIMCEEYRKLYRNVWSMKHQRKVMANAMNVTIGDDHDYFDDFGSLPPHWNSKSNEYFVACVARQVYWEYQRQLLEDVPFDDQDLLQNKFFDNSEGYSLNIHPQVGLIMIDMRAGRSFTRSKNYPLLGEQQWGQLENDFNVKFADKDVLLIVTPVPFVFLGTNICNALLSVSDYLNDLMDQWSYKEHVPERIKLMELMRDWKLKKEGRQILIMAGDAHFGWSSEIKDSYGNHFCYQFTSSAITNNPPPLLATKAISLLGKVNDQINEEYSYTHSNWCTTQNYGLVKVFNLSQLEMIKETPSITFKHVF